MSNYWDQNAIIYCVHIVNSLWKEDNNITLFISLFLDIFLLLHMKINWKRDLDPFGVTPLPSFSLFFKIIYSKSDKTEQNVEKQI